MMIRLRRCAPASRRKFFTLMQNFSSTCFFSSRLDCKWSSTIDDHHQPSRLIITIIRKCYYDFYFSLTSLFNSIKKRRNFSLNSSFSYKVVKYFVQKKYENTKSWAGDTTSACILQPVGGEAPCPRKSWEAPICQGPRQSLWGDYLKVYIKIWKQGGNCDSLTDYKECPSIQPKFSMRD